MWNATSNPNTVYYGANFVDYVGHVEHPLVMIRPTNGQNYDSFIYGQYFNVVIEGAAAADEITKAAIEAINRLPDPVSLSDKALVQAAREAYDRIASLEQRALVTNYERLTRAEQRIADLEHLQAPPAGEQPTDPAPGNQAPEAWKLLLIVVGSMIVIIVVAALYLSFMHRDSSGPKPPRAFGKSKKAVKETEAPQEPQDPTPTPTDTEQAPTDEEKSEEKSDDESERA